MSSPSRLSSSKSTRKQSLHRSEESSPNDPHFWDDLPFDRINGAEGEETSSDDEQVVDLRLGSPFFTSGGGDGGGSSSNNSDENNPGPSTATTTGPQPLDVDLPSSSRGSAATEEQNSDGGNAATEEPNSDDGTADLSVSSDEFQWILLTKPNRTDAHTEHAFHEKMSGIWGDLAALEARTYPRFVQGVEKLRRECDERLEMVNADAERDTISANQDFDDEVEAIQKEFEDAKVQLKSRLINDLEEQKKRLERERFFEQLDLDAAQAQPKSTRKLRGHKNMKDAAPQADRQKKEPPQFLLNVLLSADEVEEDVAAVRSIMQPAGESRGRDEGPSTSGTTTGKKSAIKTEKAVAVRSIMQQGGESRDLDEGPSTSGTATAKKSPTKGKKAAAVRSILQPAGESRGRDEGPSTSGTSTGKKSPLKGKIAPSEQKPVAAVGTDSSVTGSHPASRIEGGKLFYDKKWFHRGQPVYVKEKRLARQEGVISKIDKDLVWVRRMNANQPKISVSLSSLQNGSFTIKRRAN